jgi:hypothetical protein
MSTRRPDTFSAVGSASQVTSTGTANFQTLTPEATACAMLMTVETTSCRMTFDGANPSGSNSILVPTTTGGPIVVPVVGLGGTGSKVVVASTAAANSVVTVIWLQ